WIVLNSDGLVNSARRAVASGAVRDSQGNCILAFAMNLGSFSNTRAELRGIMEGMSVAW
ncbi:hypothetical protein LINPERHAP1_LOCUS31730, partial [Linum perenne]